MSLGIPNTSWSQLITTNFLACADLPIQLAVNVGAGGRLERLPGRSQARAPPLSWRPSALLAPDRPARSPIPGVPMCEHFNSSLMPPDHEYVATGTATVEGSTTPALPFEARFTIGPMQSSVQWRSHELRDGVSAILGQVVAHTNDGFQRPAPVGTITVERLEGSTWLKAGEATSSPDGSFVVLAGMVLPTDSYFRLLYPGDYWVAANVGMPVKVWPPFVPAVIPAPMPPAPTPVVAVQPTARVKIKAVSARSRLKVDVNPNMGSKYWTFQIQRRNADWILEGAEDLPDLGQHREADAEPAQGHLPGVGEPEVRAPGRHVGQRGHAEAVTRRVPRDWRGTDTDWRDADTGVREVPDVDVARPEPRSASVGAWAAQVGACAASPIAAGRYCAHERSHATDSPWSALPPPATRSSPSPSGSSALTASARSPHSAPAS